MSSMFCNPKRQETSHEAPHLPQVGTPVPTNSKLETPQNNHMLLRSKSSPKVDGFPTHGEDFPILSWKLLLTTSFPKSTILSYKEWSVSSCNPRSYVWTSIHFPTTRILKNLHFYCNPVLTDTASRNCLLRRFSCPSPPCSAPELQTPPPPKQTLLAWSLAPSSTAFPPLDAFAASVLVTIPAAFYLVPLFVLLYTQMGYIFATACKCKCQVPTGNTSWEGI